MQEPNENKNSELLIGLANARKGIEKFEVEVKALKTQLETLEKSVLKEDKVQTVNSNSENELSSKFKYRRSFTSRLIQGGESLQGLYTSIKNYLLKHKGVRSRISWGSETFYYKRNVIAKLSIKGKSICAYLALNEQEISTLNIDEKVDTVKYQAVPAKIKITGNIKLKRAFKVIDVIMARLGVSVGEEIKQIYFYKYQTDAQLLEKKLIKPVKIDFAPNIRLKNEEVETKIAEPVETQTDKKAKRNNTKKKTKKAFSIISNIIMYTFLALCVVTVILSVVSKKEADGAVNIFGKQMRVVVSDSMEECEQTDVSNYKIKSIPVKSMIFIERVPDDEVEANEWYSTLKVGDVLTFRYVYVSQETITHRITSITEKANGGYIIELEGDNKVAKTDTLTQRIDTSISDSPNYIIGKVTGQSYVLGVIITALKTPVGIVCMVIIPTLIIAIFEIIRLVSAVMEKNKKQQQEEYQRQAQELENLRRQIEPLQRQ